MQTMDSTADRRILDQWGVQDTDTEGQTDEGKSKSKPGAKFENVQLNLRTLSGIGTLCVRTKSIEWTGHFSNGDQFTQEQDQENKMINGHSNSNVDGPSKKFAWRGRFGAGSIHKIDKSIDKPTVELVIVTVDGFDISKSRITFRFLHESPERAFHNANRMYNLTSCIVRSKTVRRRTMDMSILDPQVLQSIEKDKNASASTPVVEKNSMTIAEEENSPPLQLSFGDEDDSRSESRSRRKKDNNSRRCSISLDEMNMLFGGVKEEQEAPEKDRQDETKNEIPSKLEIRTNKDEKNCEIDKPKTNDNNNKNNNNTKNDDDDDDDDDDEIRNLIRGYLKNPSENGEATCEQLRTSYGYNLSLVPTPTKARLDRSPPRERKVKRKEIEYLRPIVEAMNTCSIRELKRLESLTNTKIGRDKNHKMQYTDKTTKKVIPPEEYTRRYLPILKQSSHTSSIRTNSRTTSTTNVASRVTKSEEKKATPTQLQNEIENEHVNMKQKEKTMNKKTKMNSMENTISNDNLLRFQKELEKAEEALHEEFNASLQRFLAKKGELEERYGIPAMIKTNSQNKEEKKMSLISTQVVDNDDGDGVDDKINLGIDVEPASVIEKKKNLTDQKRKRRPSSTSRRKSIDVGEMLGFMNGENVQDTENYGGSSNSAEKVEKPKTRSRTTNKRVIWSAKGM